MQESQTQQDRMTLLLQRHFQTVWPLTPAAIHETCGVMGRQSHFRVTVVAADGLVLGDSEADPNQMENHRRSDREEVIVALAGRPGEQRRHSSTLGVTFRYVAQPIVYKGAVVAAVRLAAPVQDFTASQTFIRDALLGAAGTTTLVSVLLALLINRLWSKPLKRIATAARQVASGDLQSPIHVRSSGELAELAAALNEMRKNLSQQIDATATGQEHLQTVVANLQDGLIAMDRDLKVVLMNQAAAGLLAVSSRPVGATIQAVVRNADILGLCEKVVTSGQAGGRQIEVLRDSRLRTLDIRMAPIAQGSDAIAYLLVIRDVTELARAAAMKAEFVANASHELRTPVATLRAAVDSFADANVADAAGLQKIAAIFNRHVTRLENMTRDLLDLHVVESGRLKLQASEFPLEAVRAWAAEMFAPRAKDKGVSLQIAVNPEGATFRSDRKLLELIVQNLVDNALKYTAAGGSVHCSLQIVAQSLVLRVSDTGCGIRQEDQAHVFERFFQVDASRTGDTRQRGTGLGLAIVKHAADRLSAHLELQSELQRGTTLTVTIPHMG